MGTVSFSKACSRFKYVASHCKEKCRGLVHVIPLQDRAVTELLQYSKDGNALANWETGSREHTALPAAVFLKFSLSTRCSLESPPENTMGRAGPPPDLFDTMLFKASAHSVSRRLCTGKRTPAASGVGRWRCTFGP